MEETDMFRHELYTSVQGRQYFGKGSAVNKPTGARGIESAGGRVEVSVVLQVCANIVCERLETLLLRQ
jgi:hypothetical protein